MRLCRSRKGTLAKFRGRGGACGSERNLVVPARIAGELVETLLAAAATRCSARSFAGRGATPPSAAAIRAALAAVAGGLARVAAAAPGEDDVVRDDVGRVTLFAVLLVAPG